MTPTTPPTRVTKARPPRRGAPHVTDGRFIAVFTAITTAAVAAHQFL